MASPITPGMAGGGGLGNVHGTLTIDTSQLQTAAATARLLGRQMEQALAGVDRQSKQTESGLNRVGKGLRDLRGEMLALSATLTLATAKGFQLAGGFQETQILLKGILGSTRAATEQIERGRRAASEYGRPLNEVLSIYTKLSPILKGNADSLDRAVALAARLKVLNPGEDAAFAVREFLSGDPLSLIERFNIPRSEVRGLANEFGYTLETLEMLLDRMGITNELAQELGASFNSGARRMTDALAQLMAAGFTPLINMLTPVIQETADFLQTVSETNPEVLQWGAGLLVVATSGGVLLTVLAQVLDTATKLKAVGLFSALARGGGALAGMVTNPYVAAGAGIAAAGIYGGNQLTRLEGRLTGDEGKANRTLSQDWEILRRNLFSILRSWSELNTTIRTKFADAVASVIEGLGRMVIGMGQWLQQVGSMIPLGRGAGIAGIGAAAELAGNTIVGGGDFVRGVAATQNRMARQNLNRTYDQLGLTVERQDTSANLPTANDVARQEAEISAERKRILADLGRNLARLERDTANQRADAVEQYNKQVADTVEDYNRQLARDNEDWAIQRARAEADLQRQIDQVIRESARQRQRLEEDLAENIGDLREQAAERAEEAEEARAERVAEVRKNSLDRLAELERNNGKERERAAEDHRLKILNAAARLDAVTLYQEQERFQQEAQARAQAHADSVAQERRRAAEQVNDIDQQFAKQREADQKNLDKQIEQAQEAFDKQMEQLADNEATRLAEMQDAFRRQQEEEEADRKLRLERQEEDHGLQLAEMEEALGDQLTAIQEAYDDQYTAMVEAHGDQLDELGEFHKGWKQAQDDFYEDGLEAHKQFLKDLSDLYPGSSHPSEADLYDTRSEDPTQPPFMPPKATGGYVPYNGAAYLHAGEQILSPATVQTLSLMLGNRFNQRDLVGAVTAGAMGAGGGSSSLTIERGAVTVYAAPGQDEQMVARMVDQMLHERYAAITRGRI